MITSRRAWGVGSALVVFGLTACSNQSAEPATPSAPARTTTFPQAEPNSWTQPVAISPAGTQAINPVVGMSDDGRHVVAAWLQRNPAGDYDLVYSTGDMQERRWSAPAVVGSAGAFKVFPTLSLSGDGRSALLAWTGPSGGDRQALTAVGTRAADDDVFAWQEPMAMAYSDLDALLVRGELSADGSRAIVQWTDRSQKSYLRIAELDRVTGAATWSPGLATAPTNAAAMSMSIRLSADGSRAVASWIEPSTPKQSVMAAIGRLSAETADWSPAERLSATDDAAPQTPHLAMSRDASLATVAWAARGGIRVRFVRPAAGKPTWSNVERPFGRSSFAAQVAVDSGASAAISYDQRGEVRLSTGRAIGDEMVWRRSPIRSGPGCDGLARLALNDSGNLLAAGWVCTGSGQGRFSATAETGRGKMASMPAISGAVTDIFQQEIESSYLSSSAVYVFGVEVDGSNRVHASVFSAEDQERSP